MDYKDWSEEKKIAHRKYMVNRKVAIKNGTFVYKRDLNNDEPTISIDDFKILAERRLKQIAQPHDLQPPIFEVGQVVETIKSSDKHCCVRTIIGIHKKGIVLTKEAIPLIKFKCGEYYVHQLKLQIAS